MSALIIFVSVLSNKYTYFALFVANLVIGILERSAINECGYTLWGCIIAATALYFIYFIKKYATLIYQKNYILHNPQPNLDNSIQNIPMPWYLGKFVSNILSLCFIGINVWVCIAYFSLDSECKSFYMNNHVHLLNMLLANFIYFFIIVFVILCLLIYICITLKAEQIDPIANAVMIMGQRPAFV